MFSSAILALFSALFLVDVSGQKTFDNCANVKPMPNLDSSQMDGVWYFVHYAEFGVVLPYARPMDPRCAQRNYTTIASGSFNLHAKYTDQDDVLHEYDEVLNTVNGVIRFQDSPYRETNTIINTDYVGFSLSANCITVNGVRGYFLSVHLRQRTLQLDVAANITRALQDAGLSGTKFNEIDQCCGTSGSTVAADASILAILQNII